MMGVLPVYTVAVFLTLVLAISNAKIMKNSVEGGVEMIADLDVKTANLQLFFSVLLALSLFAAKLF